MQNGPRFVAQLSVPLDAAAQQKLLEILASRMVAEGRRITIAETVRRLIREAPVPPAPLRSPRAV